MLRIRVDDDLAERLVAWGDISGDGRIRLLELQRMLKASAGYLQLESPQAPTAFLG